MTDPHTNSQTYNEADFPSLDIVLQISRDMLSGQISYVESLDTKANFILGASTLLTAAAIALRGTNSRVPANIRCLGVIAIVVYLIVVGLALWAYMLRKYHQAPNPIDLEPYMWENQVRTKGDVLHEVVEAYKNNKTIIESKALALRLALFALGGEALLLAILALAQVLN